MPISQRALPRRNTRPSSKRLQEKLAALHNKIYRKRIPVVICYEGWDAAGKGGNIRRLAYPLSTRAGLT